MTGELGVVVVNHNTAALLLRCLASVRREAAPIVVVDNGSSDGSAEMVRREFPDVKLLARDDNPGYGAAANAGLAALETPYALLLNADTIIRPGAVAALAGYLDRHPRVAIVGPRLLDARGALEQRTRRFPSPLALLLQESGVRQVIDRLPTRRGAGDRAEDWVLGAALAVRRDAFDAVGGFDERYFLYQEEVDLCFRLRQAAWDVRYTPVATVLHVGGASTRQREAEMLAQFARSTVRFAARHLGDREARQVRLVLSAVFAARIVRDRALLRTVRNREGRRRLQARLASWRSGLAVVRRSS